MASSPARFVLVKQHQNDVRCESLLNSCTNPKKSVQQDF